MRIAVSTFVFTPSAPSAELSASELMTVAHMPIWSPFTRSKPFDAPLSPRKMLPPPITIPICTPISCTSLICSAYSPRRTGSIPKLCLPMRLSPLSLRRILLNFAMLYVWFVLFCYLLLLGCPLLCWCTLGGAAVSAAPTELLVLFFGWLVHLRGCSCPSCTNRAVGAILCLVGALETSAPPYVHPLVCTPL